MTDNLENLKIQVKENILLLLNSNKVSEAQDLINEYKKMVSNDIEVFSIQSVIDIQKNDFDGALRNIQDGLAIDSTNFDLKYNLAYLYEMKEEYAEAARIYRELSRDSDAEKSSLAFSAYELLRKQYAEFIQTEEKPAASAQQKVDDFQLEAKPPEKKSFRPKVSIIIPTFNQIGALEQILEDALNQEYMNTEIIVADYASTDGSDKLVEDFSLDIRVKYYKFERDERKYSDLYSLATGDYVLAIEANKYLEDSGYIAQKVERLARTPHDKNSFYILNDKKILTTEEREPLVTIGVTNYNAEKYVEECIKSILEQTYKEIEILIIDDVSTDGSVEILRRYAKRFNNITIIQHEKNSGSPDAGRQEIINVAKGTYFMLFDSDDYFADNRAVAKLIEAARATPYLDYIYCNLQVVDEKGQPKEVWQGRQYDKNQIIHDTFRRGGSGILNMKGLFRTEFFRQNKIDYLSNGTAGDTLTILSCMKYDMRFLHFNQALLAYRQHAENFTFDIAKRVSAILNNMEYIVEQFDKQIYFPEYEWQTFDSVSSQAGHAFLIVQFYFSIFKQYYTGKWVPWEHASTIDAQDNLNNLVPLKNAIVKYIQRSAEVSPQHKNELQEILGELNKIYGDNYIVR